MEYLFILNSTNYKDIQGAPIELVQIQIALTPSFLIGIKLLFFKHDWQ